MKMKFTTFFVVLLFLFNATIGLKAQAPQISTDGNDIWYYVKCSPRNPDVPEAKWLTGAADGGELTVAEFSKADSQLWKAVANGDGYALVNKATGTYMNTDRPWFETVAQSLVLAIATPPATAVKFVPSLLLTNGINIVNTSATVAADNTIDAATMTFSFYSAGSGIFKPISYNAINVHSSVKFMQKADFLREVVDVVTKALANSSEGNNPGQFASGSISGLSDGLDYYVGELDNSSNTLDQFMSLAQELNDIYEDFKTQVNLPELSTSTTNNWYFIQGTRPANTYLTSLGAGLKVADKPVIPDDTQLWKLVSKGSGGFAMQNKATGEFINADVVSGTEFTTQPEQPQSGLRFITSSVTSNNIFRFWIENDTGSEPALRFHAGGANNGWNAMNWTGNKDDNCTWLFMSYSDALRMNFIDQRTAARATLDAMASGAEFGQYSAELVNGYKAAVEAAELLNPEDMDEQECIDAAADLKDAEEGLVCNSDLATLQSATPAETDKLFRLVNAATADYAKNKAMSSNGRELGEKFTFENIDTESDMQLFAFELNEAGTAVKTITNKANGMYVGADGTIIDTPDASIEFTVERLDGNSFRIIPTGNSSLHAQQTGSHIVNWNSGVGSASAWRFVYVKEASNIVLLPAARTIAVTSNDPSKGTAYLTGTTEVVRTTDIQKVSVTATALKGFLFEGWTNAQDEVVSKNATYIYTGEDNIELTANFVDGYYADMKRFYVSANPSLQQENRYLTAASVTVGEQTQVLFTDVTTNPNPIDVSVAQNDRIGEAVVDYTTTQIEIPFNTTTFDLTCVGRLTEETEENLQWTQQIAFIDWNQDFDFVDAGEMTAKNAEEYDTLLIDPAGYTRTIEIPTQLPEGYYRMRVIYHEPVSSTANWGLSIWTNNEIRNGVAYDFEIKYGAPNKVETATAVQLKVRVMNSVIVVDGVENFELYTITGQRLDHRQAVRTGVYFVKAAGTVQKVLVK